MGAPIIDGFRALNRAHVLRIQNGGRDDLAGLSDHFPGTQLRTIAMGPFTVPSWGTHKPAAISVQGIVDHV